MHILYFFGIANEIRRADFDLNDANSFYYCATEKSLEVELATLIESSLRDDVAGRKRCQSFLGISRT